MNQLSHLAEFQEILAHYQISDAGEQVLAQTTLVLLAAPTASGRNTIISELLDSGKYHYTVSDTTREPRVNDGTLEKNGETYWFIDEDEFLGGLLAGKYLEAAIIHNQQVSGISIRELEEAAQDKKIAISDIEIKGVDSIITVKPDTIAIFVLPPSFNEWQSRIKARGNMEAEEFRRRIQSAYEEFQSALRHDYYIFVINDHLKNAVSAINKIVGGAVPDEASQTKARSLIKDLVAQTKQLLDSLPNKA